jgi:hypothetical protein
MVTSPCVGDVVSVRQVPLVIPDAMLVRLDAGEFMLLGGVLRERATGQIVKHLADASPADAARAALTESIPKALRSPKGVAVIGLGVVVVAAGGAYLATRKTRAAQPELPPPFEDFNASMAAYLDAASQGALDLQMIDRLIADLDALEAESERGTITIAFTAGPLLVRVVAHHTRMLLEANQLGPSNLPALANPEGATIKDLRPYLELQRGIFRREA